MNLDYLEKNGDYVRAMEEAIVRLKADGRFLTTQSLYAFVGPDVAGSKAQVAAFLKERGDAPQEDAFWDLRGRIGTWSTQHGMYGEGATPGGVWLTRIAGEFRWAHDAHVLYEILEVHRAPGTGARIRGARHR